MIAGSLLLGLLSMTSFGLANAASLPLARRYGAARLLWLRGVIIVLTLLVVSAPVLMHVHDWRAALAAFAIGVLGYIPPLAFTHGIKVSRVSIVSPIAATAPLITVLLSVAFLSTQLHAVQWLGVVVIIIANVAISVNFRDWRNSNILKLASGVPFGLIAAALWGLVFFLLIYPTRAIGPLPAALLLELGVMVAALAHVLLRREKPLLREIANKRLIFNGWLILAGTLSYTIGVKWFDVGLVAALSNSMAVVAIIAASIMHHERLTRTEKLLAAMMAAGVILISIS